MVERIRKGFSTELSWAEQLYGVAADVVRSTRGRQHESLEKQFAWLQLARMTSAFRSAMTLFVSGAGTDSIALGRTVVEVGIDLEYVLKKPEERLQKYFNFGHLLAHRLEEALAALYPDEDPEPGRRAAFEEVREERGLTISYEEQQHESAEILKNIDPKLKSWTKAGVDQRATEIGAKTFAYDLVYADGCAASHSGVGGLAEFWGPAEVEPRTPVGSMPVINLSGFFLSSIMTVTHLFGVDQSKVMAIGREMKLLPDA